MATAVFVQYKNSVDSDTEDPNDEVFSPSVPNPSGRASPQVIPNIPSTKKKPALPSVLKETTNPSPWNRYQSCNGDVQINGRHDVDESDEKIVVDHFEVLQQTLKACRESLDRIDRFRSQPDRKRRLAYAARTFGLTTRPSPLVTSHHSASDVTAAGNRCVVDSTNTCSPAVSGADTCSTRGHEAAPIPWCASSGTSSLPPTHSPSPPPTGDTLSTSSPTTSSTTPVGSTPTVSSSPHSSARPDSPTTPVKSATPTTPIETDSSTSSQNCARPSTPFIRCKALPFTSSSPPNVIGIANTQISSSTNHPSTPHPSSSALLRPIPSSTPSPSPCTPTPTSSSSSSVPSQPPGSSSCHVPLNSAAPTTPPSAHPHLLHDDQGRLDAQKNTRSSPRLGGLGPRGRSHSDGGEAGGISENGGGDGKGVMQAEVEEITEEFEEAVGMAEGKDLADLIESAVDETETAVDGDENDGDDGEVEGAGTWRSGGSFQAVNGFVYIMNDGKMEPSSGSGGQRERSNDCRDTQDWPFDRALNDCHAFETPEDFASPWPEDYGEDTLDRLDDVKESEKDCTTRFLNQRHGTCLYRGKRTRMEREAKFGGKLRVRFADDVGGESENNGEKDACEHRNRICATSDMEEHLDWLQVSDLDHRMNHVEENMLYILDSLDRLLKADDRKVGRYDTFSSVHGSRDAETSTQEDDSSPYYHYHYHHHHHLSHSIIVMFIICMIFILCILLLLPVVARTVTLAYVPGQPVF